jgi:nicotinate phosphoribosyltransferase
MSAALFTDLYELTMMAGYHADGRAGALATFDLFHRHAPRGVDVVVACGLDPVLDYLEDLRFSDADLDYLRTLELFDDHFIAVLAELRFTGEVWAVPEGLPVFPHEPMIRVTAPLAEAQLVETFLLNRVCYSSLVASNAAQLADAARGKPILEFGARRAHGPDGALTGARAAIIGGCTATSNVAAGQRFDIPLSGTQAHSWIMAFPDELSSFRAYARAFGDSCVLLVDTYDTLRSGLPNAITVAHELAEQGSRLQAIRLDSGDLQTLARAARLQLDGAGLREVRILASGDLDAERIAELEAAEVPIDGYGVGTSLLTAAHDPTFSGVYKLAEIAGDPVLKISGTPAKATDPGRKQVWRTADGDVIGLEEEERDGDPLLRLMMTGGRRQVDRVPLPELAARAREALAQIRPAVRERRWTVRRSAALRALRDDLVLHVRASVG